MSTLSGHKLLTIQAIKELKMSCANHPIGSNFNSANIPSYVIQRDILDVVSLGHWGNYGQPHHFMRKFDGQSPYQAYNDSVKWIQENALRAAVQMRTRIKKHMPNMGTPDVAPHATKRSCGLFGMSSNPQSMVQARKILGGAIYYSDEGFSKEVVNWQTLGNALHAIQDSFSEGHVVRNVSKSEMSPGSIEHIKQYAGSEKNKHKHYDELWLNEKTKQFTLSGRHAINATKSLITIITNTAQANSSEVQPLNLIGWHTFKSNWLVTSTTLDKKRDFAFDFILEHQTGIRFGASNIKTINMDEEKLAKNLIYAVGIDMKKVFDVFHRLDKHYNSDSDDIALLYISKLKQANSQVQDAFKSHKQLISLLTKIMREGYTGTKEKEAIEYLSSLK